MPAFALSPKTSLVGFLLQFFNADCNMLQQWEKKLQIILDYSSLSNFSSDGNLFIFKRGANQLEKVLTVVVSCFLFKIVGNSELFGGRYSCQLILFLLPNLRCIGAKFKMCFVGFWFWYFSLLIFSHGLFPLTIFSLEMSACHSNYTFFSSYPHFCYFSSGVKAA